jgi:hypothetical protein
MPISRDEWINGVRAEVVQLWGMLEPLESGKMQLGERRAGEPWQDGTQAQIDHLKRTIAMLQSIVDRHDA